MAEDDKIRYRDIIEPDDSIERLINQLNEVNKSYESMVNAIRAGADRIANSLKQASGATAQGKKEIDDATVAADRLERAYKELQFAMSDTGKQVAWLKAQTSDQNRMTVEQQRYIRMVSDSYDRLKADLKENIALYKSLSAAERENSEMGGRVLDNILELKAQLKALDNQMKPHIEQLTAVQKAEQRLNFLLSEEGQRYLELQRQIREVTNGRREQKEAIDPLVAAQERLARAQSQENIELQSLKQQTNEANRLAKLQAQLANSAEGSYNALAAQYGINVIKLNAMSAEMRENTEAGRALEETTRAIRARMSELQEATGNYTMNVGHYEKAWNGLTFSVQQVVRELPAMAVSMNTFFLAISNNVPMVIDEIRKLREQNKLLAAEGRQQISVTRAIIRSLISWQSALVVLLSVFSMYGKEILDWINKTLTGRSAALSMVETMERLNDEIEKNVRSYGGQMATLRRLSDEWNNLGDSMQKQQQWLKDNQNEFNKLDVTIDNVNTAEKIFTDNTDTFITALEMRAKAQAAYNLLADSYGELIKLQNEQEVERMKATNNSYTFFERSANYFKALWRSTFGEDSDLSLGAAMATQGQANVEAIEEDMADVRTTIENQYKTWEFYIDKVRDIYKELGIDEAHKQGRKGCKGREPRDLTDAINRNDIEIHRKYETSITELIQDEYAKRMKAADDEIQDENAKLRDKYRKNEEYIANVEGKYKELTDTQKEQIAEQQRLILATIDNNLRLLGLQIRRIMNEQQVAAKQIARNVMVSPELGEQPTGQTETSTVATQTTVVTHDASQMEQSLVEERQLMEENLNLEYQLTLESNRKLLEAGDEHARSEEEIIIEFNKKRLELWADYDKQILDIRQTNIDNQLEMVKKGSDQELQLLLRQNEIARQRAIAENAAKPAAQQQSTADINAVFGQRGQRIQGNFYTERFDQQQALDEAIFNEVERSEREISNFKLLQERERWQQQIRLAESGALDWSQAQIDTAKSTVEGINRELKKVGIGADIKSTSPDIKGGLQGFITDIADNGLGGTLLDRLGFNEDQIEAMTEATNIIISNIQSIMEAEVEAAEQAVELAQQRVDAAQAAYEAEVEARNNGYANNVATAKKELQQEKKNQLQKQKMLEAAQRRQQALDTVTQTTSLITASALLWKSFAGTGPAAPFLAAAAIAAMWTSFAVAKVKAAQVTKASEEYGEGGLEFLEGGSHASGNDIDLGTTNHRGRRMRAEGGEALAIVNRRNTRKYRKVLPDVIDSFNKGTFEDKYLNAFANNDNISIAMTQGSNNIDLSKLESDVSKLVKQNEVKYYALPNGTIITQYKNVKRIIKN